MTVVAFTVAPASPARAEVMAVSGGAYGYFANLALFGGPPGIHGPTPEVTLPPTGADPPLIASAPSGRAQYGPARPFDSGPIEVSTQGTLGRGGSVASTASIVGNADPDRGPLRYQRSETACTASESGVSASTKITGGFLETKVDAVTADPLETFTIPASPEPNLAVEGTIDNVGQNFRVVFNEQFVNGDGSITVNAIHQYSLGPIAVGDIITGQVRCGVTGDGLVAPPDVSAGSGSDTSSPTTGAGAAPADVTPQADPASASPGAVGVGSSPAAESVSNPRAAPAASAAQARSPSSGSSTPPGSRSLAATGRDLLPWALATIALVGGGLTALRLGQRRRAPYDA